MAGGKHALRWDPWGRPGDRIGQESWRGRGRFWCDCGLCWCNSYAAAEHLRHPPVDWGPPDPFDRHELRWEAGGVKFWRDPVTGWKRLALER